MTRSQLRTRILDGLNESSTSPQFWSPSEVNGVIQDAQEVLAESAHAVKRTGFLPLQPGTIYYPTAAIGPDVIAPYRIWHPYLHRKLEPVTWAWLDERHETWATVTGDPWVWFPVSWDTFGVWPASTTGGGMLRVDYLAWPRELLDDGDEPEYPDSVQDALVLYGIYDGFCKQWRPMDAVNAWSLLSQEHLGAMNRLGAGRIQTKSITRGENGRDR